MQLNFQKSVCAYLDPVLREVQNQEQTQELKLSDGLPDIGRILSAWGQVILRGKEWRGDGIAFSGGVMVWVLYAPEDGSAPRCIESWIPFQMKWDLADAHREGNIRIHCLLRFVDARSVAARKILIRCGVAAMGEAFLPGEAEMGVPGELPEDVQLLTNTYPVRLPREAGEKVFLMDEDLTLPGSCPLPEKLIYYAMEPKVTDEKVMANKVVFRGSGNLHVLYTSQEGELNSWDFELPFSQFADLEGSYSADAQADIRMALTSLELELDDESHLRLKCGLLGQYLVDDRQLLTLVEDAYSPSRQVELDTEDLRLPVILEQKRMPIQASQSVHQDAKSIVDVGYLPDMPRQRRTGDTVQLELPGQFQVLFCGEDGSLQSGTARFEGSEQLDAGEDSSLSAAVLMGPRAQGEPYNGSIELKAEPELLLTSMAREGIPMVMGLELGEVREADPGRPSVILRRTGESRLWDIAKSTGSTVEAIKKANALENEPVRDQILLIPVS